MGTLEIITLISIGIIIFTFAGCYLLSFIYQMRKINKLRNWVNNQDMKIGEKIKEAKHLERMIKDSKKDCQKRDNQQEYWYHRGRHMMLLTLIDELEELLNYEKANQAIKG